MPQQGKKNRLIEIHKRSKATNTANESAGWVLHKSKWAEIKGETGMGTVRKAASAEGIVTPLDAYSFRVNYDRSIDTTMQVRTREGDCMDIVKVLHDMAGRSYTDIVCSLGGANG